MNNAAAWPPSTPNPGDTSSGLEKGREALDPYAEGVYVNFISDEDATGVESTYRERLGRLRQAIHDPVDFFRLNANITPTEHARS